MPLKGKIPLLGGTLGGVAPSGVPQEAAGKSASRAFLGLLGDRTPRLKPNRFADIVLFDLLYWLTLGGIWVWSVYLPQI